ncbi:DUF742 domain-containing protein [Actinomycetospora termitidis]|uniref:DUF742 domain-containing protein n=1 Tax=Actinomycetospora termitidis TaxID=3053470 RepID=A0ABT7MC67_9PSEU|nr:DUF742 domain-containing protein [Actinomycetospora sp. Odt1-22]MDL5158238.1 DUF742 domain-containing protein [Actinomycetospora sp. Odt1-22]
MTDEDESEGRRGRLRRRPQVGRTGARFPRPPAPEPEVEAPTEAPAAVDVPSAPTPTSDALVGRTGARFNSRARRDRRRAATGPLALPPGPSSAGAPPAEAPVADDTMIGRTGARFGSRARQVRRDEERRAAEDAVVPVQAAHRRERYDPLDPRPDDSHTAPLHLAELKNRAEGYESRVSVRPYVRTRGRTRARPDLLVETLISLPRPRPPLDDPEQVAIGDLCDRAPRSVAEIAALMQVPLGVARVLIGDMADDGTVTVHPTAAGTSRHQGPDREVMARVLRGLHRL